MDNLEIEKVEITNSSTIQNISYDFLTENVDITFKSGAVYRFCGIPYELFSEMKKAESVGSYFHKNIKQNYDFRVVKTKTVEKKENE
jgi:hypothetical protein